jgi:hypothetical protein
VEQQKSSQLEQFDRNMRRDETVEEGLIWRNPKEGPFGIGGFPWIAQEGLYRRLPVQTDELLPKAVDWLADCTAGGHIRFVTDSLEVHVKVKLKNRADMYHMPPTGQCGFDCYIGEPGEEMFAGTASFRPEAAEYSSRLCLFKERRQRSVTLYFPLYQGVEEVWVGLDAEASVKEPVPFGHDRPIVIYGTSITQGGCASRPGMAYTNILSRRMSMEIVNLGFSGSGKGEPEVAAVVASIPEPACLVLDYEANCDGLERLRETLPVFIRIIRERHPHTPVVVVTRVRAPKAEWDMEFKEAMLSRREYQLGLVRELREAGDRNLYSVDGYSLMGDGFAEGTVDGTHPTDLGFLQIAEGLLPILQLVVKGS